MTDAWDPEKIKKAAEKSGKSLEVDCATAFLKSQSLDNEGESAWQVFLSSYYEDRGTDKIKELYRELDVLAQKTKSLRIGDSTVVNCTLTVLASCKNFPEDNLPVAYSVSRSTVQEFQEPLLLHHISHPVKRSIFDKQSARLLLRKIGQVDVGDHDSARRIIGFDTLHGKGRDSYTLSGDKSSYQGLDSAIKAALYWSSRDAFSGYYAKLYVPVLVLGRQWRDIPFDSGRPGEPKPTDLGYVANLYPVYEGGAPLPLMCLVASRTTLASMVGHMESLFEDFLKASEEGFRKGEYTR